MRRAVVAVGTALALLGAGGTGVWLATAPDRVLADSYRSTLDTADGRSLAALDLTTGATPSGAPPGAAARSVGTVFLYAGNPSWAYVVVRDAGPAARYAVTATVRADIDDQSQARPYHPEQHNPGATTPGATTAGATRDVALGSCAVSAGTCSAGGVLRVPVGDVVSVRLTAPDGSTWATATRP